MYKTINNFDCQPLTEISHFPPDGFSMDFPPFATRNIRQLLRKGDFHS